MTKEIFEDELEDNEVVVASKANNIYQRSLIIASTKNGGSVLLRARGRHMLKAMDISVWATEKFNFVVEKIATRYIQNGNGHTKEKVAELKILMKKRAMFTIAILPIGILMRSLHPVTSPIVDTFLSAAFLDIVVPW